MQPFRLDEVLAMSELRHKRGEKIMGYAMACAYLVYLKSDFRYAETDHGVSESRTLVRLSVDRT